MQINIYQINESRDTNDVMFVPFEHAASLDIDPKIYDRVFSGELSANSLEEVFQLLNSGQIPEGYMGRSLSISDVCEVIQNGKSECFYCDSVGFKKIEFDVTQTMQPKETEMTVVACQPGKKAAIAKLPGTLEGMQQFVGGYIEAIYPYEDPVAIICNEEGKLNGMPLNRALYTEEGEMFDIVAGPMFICGLGEDNFQSLTEDQQQKYLKQFEKPELFFRMGDKIQAIQVDEKATKEDRGQSHRRRR